VLFVCFVLCVSRALLLSFFDLFALFFPQGFIQTSSLTKRSLAALASAFGLGALFRSLGLNKTLWKKQSKEVEERQKQSTRNTQNETNKQHK
jgi:hypothetical protein